MRLHRSQASGPKTLQIGLAWKRELHEDQTIRIDPGCNNALLQVGFSTDRSPLLGQFRNRVAFDANGSFITSEPGASTELPEACKPFGRHVVGVLVELCQGPDAGTPGALPSLDDGGKEPFKQIRCVCHSHRMRQSLFYETTLCKFFEKGKCSRGNNCNFAHGRRRLRDKPDLAKTKWCAAFLESGSCPLGAQECPYAHDRDEKRKYRGKHVVSVDQTAELYISDTSDVLAESIRTEQPDSSVAAGSNFT
eukprot:s5908_g1.t1